MKKQIHKNRRTLVCASSESTNVGKRIYTYGDGYKHNSQIRQLRYEIQRPHLNLFRKAKNIEFYWRKNVGPFLYMGRFKIIDRVYKTSLSNNYIPTYIFEFTIQLLNATKPKVVPVRRCITRKEKYCRYKRDLLRHAGITKKVNLMMGWYLKT